MALAANIIITQSSTAAYAPVAKARDNASTDQTSSFGDVLAKQDSSAAGNNAQAPAQGTDKPTDKSQDADKAKTSKNTQLGNKLGNASDDQANTDAIPTGDASQGTKVRAGKPADKAKNSTTDVKSASDAVNDNEYANNSDLNQQMPQVPPPIAPAVPQPSSAADASSLEAIGNAANGAKPAATGANDTNNTEAAENSDDAQTADEAQPADGAPPTSGKAQSSTAFQKMLGATKAAAAKDSQATKGASDKDIKTADANVDGANTVTDGTLGVKSAAPANTGMTNGASTTAPVDKTVTPATSAAAAAATTQSHAAPNLNSLAVEITTKAQSGAKQFDIRLDPPELGRVEVRLSIDATGKAQAHLSADRPQTLELLQKDAPALTRALRDAGLDVSQSGLNFSLKNQQQNSGGNNSASQSNYDGAATSSANVVLETNSGGSAYSGGAGLLDIKI